MPIHIAMSVEENEAALVKINQEQMLLSRDVDERPLIHAMTGVPTLSPAYARLKSKTHPNLKDSGKFQGSMFLSVDENRGVFFLDSEDYKSRFLVDNYGKGIFGIPLRRVPEAKAMNFKSFGSRVKKLIFKK